MSNQAVSVPFVLRRQFIAAMLLLAATTVWFVSDLTVFAAEQPKAAAVGKSWSGSWNNRKYNTTGALTCSVIGEQNGQWIARFTGTGLGKPFNYTALITHKPSGTNTTLQGTTRVDGDNYNWSGTISGNSLNGSFRSTTGNNGEFRLTAAAPPAAGKGKK